MRMLISRIGLAMVAAVMLIPAVTAAVELDEFVVAVDSWAFDNFGDAELSWEIYRMSFIGIPPDPDPISATFDYIFYEAVYKDQLAGPGNCYGMSVMALLMLEHWGCEGFCGPANQYTSASGGDGPSDMGLHVTINQIHGHQVSLPSVQYMLEIIAQGDNRDGRIAYAQFHECVGRGDPVVISITESLSPTDGGHTMLPYDAVPYGSDEYRIYVYDPNNPWTEAESWYNNGENYIKIDTNSGEWWFDDLGWSGHPAGGGNCMVTPLSIAGPRSRVPTSYGDLGSFLTTIFISGSETDITQVTDSDGKRLFKPGTYEVDTDPATGMRNMMLWIPSDQPAPTDKKIYFRQGGQADKLEFDLLSGVSGYAFGLIGEKSYVSVTSRGGAGKDVAVVENAGGAEPALVLHNQTGSTGYDIEFHQVIEPRRRSRIFKVNNMRIDTKGQPVVVALSKDQKALEISTTATSATYSAELTDILDGEVSTAIRRDLSVPRNSMQSIEPNDWMQLKADEFRITGDTVTVSPNRLKSLRK